MAALWLVRAAAPVGGTGGTQRYVTCMQLMSLAICISERTTFC